MKRFILILLAALTVACCALAAAGCTKVESNSGTQTGTEDDGGGTAKGGLINGGIYIAH